VSNNHQLLPSLRSGLAATQHPFGDGLHYAKAAANQQHQPTLSLYFLSKCSWITSKQSQQPVQGSEPLQIADHLWRTIEWNKFIHEGALAWHWSPNAGFSRLSIVGFNEAEIVIIAAIKPQMIWNAILASITLIRMGFTLSLGHL